MSSPLPRRLAIDGSVTGGGTDASAIQRTRAGALSTTIGAPVRYMHSTVQLCHKDDIDATVALLKVFLENAHKLAY
jgi:endoglucanase